MNYSSVVNSKGVTLIELIVAMVVMAIAMTGVMLVINYTTSHSADPVLRHQALAIAESYMEEISLKDVTNPVGGYTGTDRSLFDDVYDYEGLNDSGATDAYGNVIAGLENYSVAVSVVSDGFGPSSSTEVTGARIEVTVTDPAGQSLSLSGYRADY